MIYNRRFTEEAQSWLDELWDEAYINIIAERVRRHELCSPHCHDPGWNLGA